MIFDIIILYNNNCICLSFDLTYFKCFVARNQAFEVYEIKRVMASLVRAHNGLDYGTCIQVCVNLRVQSLVTILLIRDLL